MIDLTDTAEVVELLNRAVAEKGADYEYPGAGMESSVSCDWANARA